MGWDGEGVLAGRYRKMGRIGQGGMGSVWRAHDTDLDREVAIKELRVPEQVTEQQRRVWYARMGREARAARLRHPGIVTVYDRVIGGDHRPWSTVIGTGGQPAAEAVSSGPARATRVDAFSRSTDDGARNRREYPIAVRGAVICTGIAYGSTPFLPWYAGIAIGDRSGMTIIQTQNAHSLVAILALAIIFSWGLWALAHRPVLTLATVAVINLGLILGTLAPFTDTADGALQVGAGFAFCWLVGAAAFMFAFAGTNRLLVDRMPSTSLRQVLLSIAVVAEGFIAMAWPLVIYLPADVALEIGGSDYDGPFRALLVLAAVAWVAVQPVIWSDRVKAKLSR